mmetsp:Transcript_21975/g.32745  ORF Transcript_21975/g.32745 Transcript_21975/m.32745 type:complete len:445 (+) Transcript_21975:10-1344(+)
MNDPLGVSRAVGLSPRASPPAAQQGVINSRGMQKPSPRELSIGPTNAPPSLPSRRQEHSDRVESFFADRPQNAQPSLSLPNLNTLAENEATVKKLMASGRYRMAAKMARLLLDTTSSEDALLKLNLRYYLGCCHLRLKNTKEATDAIKLGSSKKGGFENFDLALLRCELPHYLGKTADTVENLCKLRGDLVSQRSSIQEFQQKWNLLNEKIVSYLILSSKLELALLMVDAKATDEKGGIIEVKGEEKTMILYRKCQILLMVGDVEAAEKLLETVKRVAGVEAKKSTASQHTLERIAELEALILTSKSKYVEAMKVLAPFVQLYSPTVTSSPYSLSNAKREAEFGIDQKLGTLLKVKEGSTVNVDIVNNFAVCALFANQIELAIRIMEAAIRTDPFQALNVQLIRNLVALYDLCSFPTKKSLLRRLVSLYAADDVAEKCKGLNLW